MSSVMASAAACFAPLCVASQSNRICTSRMPSAERSLRRLPRLRLRLASRRRPRFVRGHCLSVFCSIADRRSVFAIRFALSFEIAFSLCKAKPERQVLLPIGASANRLRRFSERIGSTTSAGKTRSISRGAGDVERGGIVQTLQMCVDMVTGGIPP